jgi:Flp pilus assembly pilin Flp
MPMALLRLLRKLKRQTRGAALVEFTLVAPMLLLLMSGLAEFGNALREYHIMQKGVRDAARYLAHVPANPPCIAADPNWAGAITEAKHLAVYGTISGGTALFKTWTDVNTVSVNDATCLANPRVNGNLLPKIKVTASALYADLGMFGLMGVTPPTLTVSHEELRVS